MNQDYYISLLIKDWEEKLLDKESDELNQWLNDSEQNRTLASELKESWIKSENYNLPFEIDEEKSFNRILSKIQNTESNSFSTKIIRLKQNLFRPIMTAASFLLISVFAWWLYTSIQGKTIITNNDIENIVLPDGSKVWLNKNSKLTFANSFSGYERLVKLSGEAFFEVKKDTSSPFVIETSNAFVTVLGTSFNVKANNKKHVDVTVKTGKVKLESTKNHSFILLTPNQKGILDIKTGKIVTKKDNELNSLAWKRKMLLFDDTPLIKMTKDLEELYNVKIEIQNSDLKNCPFSGKYNTNKKLDNILNDISKILKMEKIVKISKNEYLLKGGICK